MYNMAMVGVSLYKQFVEETTSFYTNLENFQSVNTEVGSTYIINLSPFPYTIRPTDAPFLVLAEEKYVSAWLSQLSKVGVKT